MSDNGYDRIVKDFAKFLIDKSENGNVDISTISDSVKEWCNNMHEQTKEERKRIHEVIYDFCMNGPVRYTGCVNCVLNELDVCGDSVGNATVPLCRLREAEKVIDEVMAE